MSRACDFRQAWMEEESEDRSPSVNNMHNQFTIDTKAQIAAVLPERLLTRS